jgi:hypothetical protein
MFLDREKVRIVAVAGIHGAVKNSYYRNTEKLLRGLLGVSRLEPQTAWCVLRPTSRI